METERSSVELVDAEVVTSFARAALFAALMGSFAYVAIPLPISPVPVTLQSLGVLLAGLFLGPIWGTFSLVLYLLTGAVGVPVFAGGEAGLGTLLGPSGGFLMGFPVVAAAVGFAVHRGREVRNPSEASLPLLILTLTGATLLLYAFGLAYYTWLTGTGLGEGVGVVVAPFVPGGVLKLVAAIAIVESGVIDPT